MSGETIITVIGNLTADPELRFTPSGSAVANFTIASTPRTFDRQANEWKDGDTLFLRSGVWREPAENVTASLTKGMRVIAQGRLKSRSYETTEGEKRTVIEFEIEEIGPSLRYAQAKVQRTQNGGNQQQGGAGQAGGQWGGGQQQPQVGGQWGNQPAQGQQQGQWGQYGAPQGQPQTQQQYAQPPQQAQQQPAQHYAQAAANGPQQGAQQAAQGYGGIDPAQAAQGQDPWATPGMQNAGGWGAPNGDQSEPPF